MSISQFALSCACACALIVTGCSKHAEGDGPDHGKPSTNKPHDEHSAGDGHDHSKDGGHDHSKDDGHDHSTKDDGSKPK